MKYNKLEFDFIFPSGGDCESGCYFQHSWVEIEKCLLDPDTTTEVIIPDGVEVIGRNAFINFVNLKKITFPESLTLIREYAFECCKSLETLEFKNPLTIKQDAFRFCDYLKFVEIGFSKSRKSPQLVWNHDRKAGELPGIIIENDDSGIIWPGAFKDCPSLKEIILCEQMRYYENDDSYQNVLITGGKKNYRGK